MSQPNPTVKPRWTTARITRFVNRPSVTITSIGVAVALGLSHWSIVAQLRPIGDIISGVAANERAAVSAGGDPAGHALRHGAGGAGCELSVPLGFTIMRFGNILHFAVAAIFIGTLGDTASAPGICCWSDCCRSWPRSAPSASAGRQVDTDAFLTPADTVVVAT